MCCVYTQKETKSKIPSNNISIYTQHTAYVALISDTQEQMEGEGEMEGRGDSYESEIQPEKKREMEGDGWFKIAQLLLTVNYF